MTKTQIRKQVRELKERYESLIADLEELRDEVEDTVDNIEPYGDRYDLTQAQEERQEWLEDVVSAMNDIIDSCEWDDLDDQLDC